MRLGTAIGIQELVAESVHPRELPLPVSDTPPTAVPAAAGPAGPAHEHTAADAR
jgi:hypothetical protein